jgi:hypothetical protein
MNGTSSWSLELVQNTFEKRRMADLVCDPEQLWAARVLLAGSPVAFLIPACVCVNRIRESRADKFGWPSRGFDERMGRDAAQTLLLLPEIIICLCTALVAVAYHFCADDAECSRRCISGFDSLYRADFMMSFMIVAAVVFHTSDITSMRVAVWKFGGLTLAFIANLTFVLVLYAPETINNALTTYYVVAAIVYGVAIALRIFLAPRQFLGEIRRTRWYMVVCGLAAMGIGIYYQSLNDRQDVIQRMYWWNHPMWHLAEALAIACRFQLAAPPTKPEPQIVSASYEALREKLDRDGREYV